MQSNARVAITSRPPTTTSCSAWRARACRPGYLLRVDLGDPSALDSAAILVAEVENPALRARIQVLRAAVAA